MKITATFVLSMVSAMVAISANAQDVAPVYQPQYAPAPAYPQYAQPVYQAPVYQPQYAPAPAYPQYAQPVYQAPAQAPVAPQEVISTAPVNNIVINNTNSAPVVAAPNSIATIENQITSVAQSARQALNGIYIRLGAGYQFSMVKSKIYSDIATTTHGNGTTTVSSDSQSFTQGRSSLIINTALGYQHIFNNGVYLASEISANMAINTSAASVQNVLRGISLSAAFKVGYAFGNDALFVPYVGVGYISRININNFNNSLHGVSPLLGFIFKPAGQNVLSMFVEASVPMYFHTYGLMTGTYNSNVAINTNTIVDQLILMPQITAGLQFNF
jgi:hypothetical protein